MLNLFRSTDSVKPDFSLACWITSTPRTSSPLADDLVSESTFGSWTSQARMLKPGKTLSADELIAYCRRSLANYKVPRRVEFSDTELPKSGSGKILKKVLRERFWTHQERAVS